MLAARFIVISVIYFEAIYSLEVTPERPGITYLNPDYIEWGNLTVTRFGRRSGYYVNVEGLIKHSWGNNVTVHLIFYEFLSNAYRRSFLDHKSKLCDLTRRDPYIGHVVARATGGRTCPFPEGEYRLMNLTTNMQDINFKWPFEKTRMNISIFKTDTKISIATGYLHVTFKQKPSSG